MAKTLGELAKELRDPDLVITDLPDVAGKRMDEAADRLEAIELALKPFAELAEVFDRPSGTTPTEGEIYVWSRMVDGKPKEWALTVEMLRAARNVIEGKEP